MSKAKRKQRKKCIPTTTETEQCELFKHIDASVIKEKITLRKYIEWLALPKKKRNPRTELQFAAESGVDPKTLYLWRRIPKFWEEVESIYDSELRRYGAEIMYSLVRTAIDTGDPKRVELYAKLVRGYSDKLKVEDTTPPKEVSPEQAEKIATAFRNAGLGMLVRMGEEPLKEVKPNFINEENDEDSLDV